MSRKLDTAKAAMARALASRWMVPVAALLAIVLAAPSLTAGFASDDWFLSLTYKPSHADLGLFGQPGTLVPRGAAPAAMDAGLLPWTASPEFSVSFLRPFADATHALDFALWPDSPAMMHAHSIGWSALFVLCAAALYRRIHGATWVAGLAMLLVAVEDGRAPAEGWIANRNIVIASALCAAGLLAYDRWRQEGWRPGAIVCPALLLGALTASEAAFGLLGYLLAYAVFLDGKRFRPLLGSIGIALAWLIVWVAGDHGVVGSAVYAEPGADPLGAVAHGLRNLPILLAGQFTGIWTELAGAGTPGWLAAVSVVSTGLLVVLVLWNGSALADREALFWLTGATLAAVPVSLAFPSDRVLVLVSLGAAPLVALAVAHPWGRGLARARRASLVGAALFMHLVLSVPVHANRVQGMADLERIFERASASLPMDEALTERRLLMVNAPSDSFAGFISARRAALGEPLPSQFRSLATSWGTVTVERVDARTLQITPDGGWMVAWAEHLLRDVRDAPFSVGDAVDVPGLTVTVTEVTPDARPASARFAFDVPLEDPGLDWVAFEGIAFVPFTPPPIGETVILGPTDPLAVLAGDL